MFRKRTPIERFWEILPGLQFWLVFFGSIILSYYAPIWAAVFIICFDLYWVLKAINVAMHLFSSYRKFRVYVRIDWIDYLRKLGDLQSYQFYLEKNSTLTRKGTTKTFFQQEAQRIKGLLRKGKICKNFSDFYHIVLIPFTDEGFEILDSTFNGLASSSYDKNKIIIVLASEDRAGEETQLTAQKIKEKYQNIFYKFFITVHPDGLPGEIRGKSANASYAMREVVPQLEQLSIPTDNVLVSNFDSDTVIHPQYFARVMYEFLLAENPYHCSFQPISIYNNNIWDSPAIIRVVSVSNSFFQFTESSRPDRLRTFSSHTMTLKTLIEVGYWKKDIVNEDGFIYWQCYLHFNGNYHVIPLFLPISLDTCLANNTWQTLKNQYKQKRRWAYNVEYYPHLIMPLLRSKAPMHDKLYKLWQYVEGNFNWATASILISSLGWLPLFLGGHAFQNSVVGFNLPYTTKTLMTIATFFLIFSVYINLVLLPPRPKKYGVWRSVEMYLQWFLVPITSVIFSSLPAIEAQSRLMFGKYLEFWVTPKTRTGINTALTMKEMQTIKNNP